MNRLVAQAFQPAGLPEFRVRWTRNGRLESRPNPQARKPALRTRLGSWSQCAPNMTWRLPMNRSAELQLGAVWRAPNAPTWRSALQARRSWCQCAPEKTSRLSLKLAAVLASLVVKGVTSIACAATFTASLDRDTITIGERATLSLRVE